MKKYTGKKTVMAKPMSMGEAYEQKLLKAEVKPSEEEKDKAGYMVVYEDGYKSWSPAEPFEKAYRCSETFIDRLKNEYRELHERCEKLEKFLSDDDVVNKVGIKQFRLLASQQSYMRNYENCIAARLIYLGTSAVKINE